MHYNNQRCYVPISCPISYRYRWPLSPKYTPGRRTVERGSQIPSPRQHPDGESPREPVLKTNAETMAAYSCVNKALSTCHIVSYKERPVIPSSFPAKTCVHYEVSARTIQRRAPFCFTGETNVAWWMTYSASHVKRFYVLLCRGGIFRNEDILLA